MPLDLPETTYTALDNATAAHRFKVGRNLHRLKRYGIYYRRLRTRMRIGVMLDRVISAITVDWGGLLGLLAIAWGAIEHRLKRDKTAKS
jgi:hypothetical protein